MSDLEAGRELDALIAEKVMGWGPADDYGDHWHAGTGLWAGSTDPDHVLGFRPSTDIAAAWQVVEHFTAQPYWCVQLDWCGPLPFGQGWQVLIGRGEDEHGHMVWAMTQAHTAPLAICRAALDARAMVEGQ